MFDGEIVSKMKGAYPASAIWQADLKSGPPDRLKIHMLISFISTGTTSLEASLLGRKSLLAGLLCAGRTPFAVQRHTEEDGAVMLSCGRIRRIVRSARICLPTGAR